jgi:GntR family transcriptional regulator
LSTLGYLHIAAWLRGRIETGELPPNERVPSISELMRLFDVGENTARQALSELKDEGLTIVHPGDGTFTREVRPVLRLVLGGTMPGQPFWPTDIRRNVKMFGSYVYEARATADVAQALGIPPASPVRVRKSSYAASRREIQLVTFYEPACLTDQTEPVRFRDELRVRLPTSPERECMGLTIASPVIDIARTSYAADGRPVELARIVLDANAYLLEYHHPAADGSAALITRVHEDRVQQRG